MSSVQRAEARPVCDVLVLGDYFFDIIYAGLNEFPELGREIHSTDMVTTGGGMFITAVSLRRLGAAVGWCAQFGNDPYSAHVRALAVSEGVDLLPSRTFAHPFRRVTTSIPVTGERAFVTYCDPDPPDLYAYWEQVVTSTAARHIHVGGLIPPETIGPVLRAARARGASVSVDANDAPHLWDSCDWQHLLSMVDVLFANAREGRLITKRDRLDKILEKLNRWVPTVVLKDGANGAYAADQRTGAVVHAPALSGITAVDTTGAGDCFNAGFLVARVVHGLDDAQALRWGNICGGLSVTGVGGATHAPTLHEMQAALAR
jgi:hypothetical protein